MAPEVKEQTRMICEQGEYSLWDTPLSEEDQKKYNEEEKNSKE